MGNFKKIGLIGGLGPESTLDYYKEIIRAFKQTYEEKGFPEIIIESLDLHQFMSWVQKNEWKEISRKISQAARSLHESGAIFGAIASNTPHKVFTQIQESSPLRLISIVESTAEHARTLGLSKLGLLGTQSTMSSDFYQKCFESKHMIIFTPTEQEQQFIQEKLFSEIEFGVTKPETKARFLKIIEKMISTYEIEGIILGCTEMPLIIKPEDVSIACLDTLKIHVEKIVKMARIN